MESKEVFDPVVVRKDAGKPSTVEKGLSFQNFESSVELMEDCDSLALSALIFHFQKAYLSSVCSALLHVSDRKACGVTLISDSAPVVSVS